MLRKINQKNYFEPKMNLKNEKLLIFIVIFIVGVVIYFINSVITGEFPYGINWEMTLWYQILLGIVIISVFIVAYKKPKMPALLALALTSPHLLGALFFAYKGSGSMGGCAICIPFGVILIISAFSIFLILYILLKIFTLIVISLLKRKSDKHKPKAKTSSPWDNI